MRYRTRLYIAFTSIAVLTLVLGGINLFSSSQVRDMEKKSAVRGTNSFAHAGAI